MRLPLLHRYTLAAVLLIAAVNLLVIVKYSDPDIWWHLRDGQLVLASGIPHADVYSYTAAGQPWFLQEWLTEVGMYMVQHNFGFLPLVLLFAAIAAAGTVLVYYLTRQAGAGRLTAFALLAIYLAVAAPTWGVRPQVLIPLLLGSFYLILLNYRAHSKNPLPPSPFPLILLPLLTLLWTNLHASYIVGVGMVGAFVVGEAANNWLYHPARPTPLRPLLLTLLACLLATLINPYFIELWTYPLAYVLNGNRNPLLSYIAEWQSPNFHDLGNLLLILSFILLAAVGIGYAATDEERSRWRLKLTRRLDITEFILLATFLTAGLQALRLLPLYALVAVPALAGGLVRTWPALGREGEESAPAVEGRLNWLVAAGLTLGLAVVLIGQPDAQNQPQPRTDNGFVYPRAAADYLLTLPPATRLYNHFAWGGYLLYRLYPSHKVFIDGRADMYRESVFVDSLEVRDVHPKWREVLARYDVNTVLAPINTPLASAMAGEADWVLAYSDKDAVVYRKR